MKSQKENRMFDLAGKFVKRETERINAKWPPMCIGFLHQPKRPVKKK